MFGAYCSFVVQTLNYLGGGSLIHILHVGERDKTRPFTDKISVVSYNKNYNLQVRTFTAINFIVIFCFLPESVFLNIFTSFTYVRPFKGLNNSPSIRVYRCIAFCTFAFLRILLHSSLSYARLLHPRIPKICNASHRKTSSHLVLRFPTVLLSRNFPLKSFWETFFFQSYDANRQSYFSNFSIIHDD